MGKPTSRGWTCKTLRDLAAINYGKSPKDILSADGLYPVVGTGGTERYGDGFLYDGESIVLGRKGTIDRVHFVTGRFWAIDTAYFLSDFNDTQPRWLLYFLQNLDLRKLNEATGVPSLSRDLLYKIEVETPPPTEQTKIAEILSTVDQAIQQTEALIVKQQRIKTGLMQDLLMRGIDKDGNLRSENTHEFKDSSLGQIPVEWKVQRLEQSVEFWDGKRIPLKQADRDQMPGDYPYYGASGIIDYVDDYLFDDDLILVGEDGENIVSRNLPLAFRVGGKIWVNNHAHVLKPKEGYNIDFLTERLEFYDYMLLISGSAQPKLNQHNLRLLKLPMPPEPEQARIGAILSGQEEWRRCHAYSLSKLQRIKAALMQDLLTGKVRVAPLLTGTDVYE